ncbi:MULTISPECIES: acyl carrier protein [Nocardiopsidaceae]|jgi:acyl carrier protein|uniref:Acyl carrier protein n=2 Tax=Nocardiopsidaceae TaxID=83676 RepID=A0ABY6YPC0_9ACTN|nr:acyl carrier protein [Streptomonospora nanhaiensis]MEE2046999.1 acyl carrier protein [Nocardiopsis tropica]WAE74086.1 acyl carrier protein [Streptomonospora nanhaiensis]
MTATDTALIDELREIVADVLEVEPEEISETGLFSEEHEADSLQAIEVLARIEKTLRIAVPQTELPDMGSLDGVYRVVSRYTEGNA